MARFGEILVGPGTCDKPGCGHRRWRLSQHHRGHSHFCEPHSCRVSTQRPGASGLDVLCLAKKSSGDLACPAHLRSAQALDRATEGRRWQEHVAWSRALCSADGCAQPRHGELAHCTRHAGFCGRADCGFMRLEGSDWCVRHQVCLHGECERPALVLCVPRGFDGSEMEVQGTTRFCAAHKACGASKLLADGEGWEDCATPVGLGEAACKEHRCAVDGCKERKAEWHDRPNAYCLLHTCAIAGCKKPTPNTAADREHRFCRKHTCKRDGCSKGSFREDRHFPCCERHTCVAPECSLQALTELSYCVQHLVRATQGDFEAARPPSTRSASASSRWTDEDAERGRDPAPRPVPADWAELTAATDRADIEQLRNMLLNYNLGSPDPRPERRHERRQRRREDSAAPRNSPPLLDPQTLESFLRLMVARRGVGR